MYYDYDDYDKVAFGTSNSDFFSQKKKQEMIFFDGQIVWNENSCVVNGNIANFSNDDFILDSLELWQFTNEFLHKICGYFDEEKGKFAFVGGEMNTEVNENIFKETVRLLNMWNTVFKKTDDNYYMLTLWARKICKHCHLGSFEEAEVELKVSKNDEDEREENEWENKFVDNDEVEVVDNDEQNETEVQISNNNFDYKGWLEEWPNCKSGDEIVNAITKLPITKFRAGQTQIFGAIYKYIENHKNPNFDNKQTFAKLGKRKIKEYIAVLRNTINSESVVWPAIQHLVNSTINEFVVNVATVCKVKRVVSKEVQEWAWVAHTISDPHIARVWEEISKGPDHAPTIHNSGGFKAWYKQKYAEVISIAKENEHSYVNEIDNENFSYTHPKSNETKERQTPAKGIIPVLGSIEDPLRLKELKTTIGNRTDALFEKMNASGNSSKDKNRIMYYSIHGSCFDSKLFYAACVLSEVNTKFASKRAHGISSGVVIPSEMLEVSSQDLEYIDTPINVVTANTRHSSKRSRLSNTSTSSITSRSTSKNLDEISEIQNHVRLLFFGSKRFDCIRASSHIK